MQAPKLNLFFRSVEIIFFLGIGCLMIPEGHILTGIFHVLLSIAYGYLFYCELSFRTDETLSIHHSGVSIPDLPEPRFLHWTHINEIEATYDTIDITTAGEQSLHFRLRHNLEFEEMER